MEAACEHRELADGYVLGTLSESQREWFDRHLRHCEACSDELELLRLAAAASALLGAGPSGARPRPQGPTELSLEPAPAAALAPQRHLERVRQRGDKRAPSSRRGRAPGASGRRRVGRRITFGSLGVIVVVTVLMSHSGGSTTFVRGTTAWPGQAGIALKLDGGSKAELLTEHLPPAPAGQHYEIWALPGGRGQTRLTRIEPNLGLNRAGEAGVQLPGDIREYSIVGIYSEPDRARPAGGGDAASPRVTVADHPAAVVYPRSR